MQWTGTRAGHRLGRLVGRRPGPAAARVLVVDDDEVIRQLIAVHLRVGGFAADLAADGRAGLERARRGRPAVAILDGGMPGLDGWAVAARLRSDPTTSSIKIVLLAPGPGGAPGTGGARSQQGGGLDACPCEHSGGLDACPGEQSGDLDACPCEQGGGLDACRGKPCAAVHAGRSKPCAGAHARPGESWCGVDACLAKPFDPAELIATVQRLARGHDRPWMSRWWQRLRRRPGQRPGGATGV
jgi:CheY-like chemotaxis protein